MGLRTKSICRILLMVTCVLWFMAPFMGLNDGSGSFHSAFSSLAYVAMNGVMEGQWILVPSFWAAAISLVGILICLFSLNRGRKIPCTAAFSVSGLMAVASIGYWGIIGYGCLVIFLSFLAVGLLCMRTWQWPFLMDNTGKKQDVSNKTLSVQVIPAPQRVTCRILLIISFIMWLSVPFMTVAAETVGIQMTAFALFAYLLLIGKWAMFPAFWAALVSLSGFFACFFTLKKGRNITCFAAFSTCVLMVAAFIVISIMARETSSGLWDIIGYGYLVIFLLFLVVGFISKTKHLRTK